MEKGIETIGTWEGEEVQRTTAWWSGFSIINSNRLLRLLIVPQAWLRKEQTAQRTGCVVSGLHGIAAWQPQC